MSSYSLQITNVLTVHCTPQFLLPPRPYPTACPPPPSELRIWQDVNDFEACILDPRSRLDVSLVYACRLLLSQYLREQQELEMNGLSIKDAILASYPDIT